MSSGDDGSRINLLISSARRVFIMKAVAEGVVCDSVRRCSQEMSLVDI